MPNNYGAGQDTTLADRRTHEAWEASFQCPHNEQFFELAFDRVLKRFPPAADSVLLEAGCGRGGHVVRLAQRGFRVVGVDISDVVLGIARDRVETAGVGNRVELIRDDLRALGFSDEAFHYIFCWGVLMHIPEIRQVVAELSRVVAPGGYVIVQETNAHSPEALAIIAAKRLARYPGLHRTPAGIDHWKQTPAGALLTRQTDVAWLISEFQAHNLVLAARLPTQLTHLYVKAPWDWLKSAIHRLNGSWYRFGFSRVAASNTLVFQRPATGFESSGARPASTNP